ncbi:hypothetical protein CsSME_00051454 [Camellia sinensis var. sinensis]
MCQHLVSLTKPFQHHLPGATPEGKLKPILSAMLYWWLTGRKTEPPYSPTIHNLYQALLRKKDKTFIKHYAFPVIGQKEHTLFSKL